MSDVVIRVEDLGKKYRIGHLASRERYVAFRDVLARTARGLWRSAGDVLHGRAVIDGDEVEDFWPLRQVNFEIRRGEVVGIIGRNGAGKSTLLKILSRITEPTEGRVVLHGKVASLLEVGTGFHPELTGRENIFLNGAILGMSRHEIRRKFDQIVAFAEVENFLDTPVKRYSSGMHVRLAFAIAAHLDPEILIIDEVLAVGDEEFQKRCLGKMSEVARGGRTVLFVSHNMSAVQALCGDAILLQKGRLIERGPVGDVVQTYLSSLSSPGAESGMHALRLGSHLTLRELVIGEGSVASGNSAEFRLHLTSSQPLHLSEAAILIYSELGARVAILDLRHAGLAQWEVSPDGLVIRGRIRHVPLVEGQYRVGLWVVANQEGTETLDIALLQVLPEVRDVPRFSYPAVHRGYVELDFEADIETVS